MTAHHSAKASLVCLLLLMTSTAGAHTSGTTGGFVSGFGHPLLGWDHVVAMLAVGLWGWQLGRTDMITLATVFPVVMGLGAGFGTAGVSSLVTEIGIAISAVAIGVLIVFAVRMPTLAAAGLVSLFAAFHGLAHGSEMSAGSNPALYTSGFMLATGLLHMIGMLAGHTLDGTAGKALVKTAGYLISIIGLGFLVASF